MNKENFTKFQLFLLRRAGELETEAKQLVGTHHLIELAKTNGRLAELNVVLSELNDLCD